MRIYVSLLIRNISTFEWIATEIFVTTIHNFHNLSWADFSKDFWGTCHKTIDCVLIELDQLLRDMIKNMNLVKLIFNNILIQRQVDNYFFFYRDLPVVTKKFILFSFGAFSTSKSVILLHYVSIYVTIPSLSIRFIPRPPIKGSLSLNITPHNQLQKTE